MTRNEPPRCNLCGSTSFTEYRKRPAEQCSNCLSKARHRVGWAVYESHLFPFLETRTAPKVLHLAPARALHDKMAAKIGSGYITSDPVPERYPHSKCLQLYFPQDFSIFPNGYFDAIIHNHVLEHIPGHYGDHLREFTRLLAPGGKMMFSIPGPYKGVETREGGEHMETDEERLEAFRQEDHFKMIGDDLYTTLDELPGGRSIPDGITDEQRAALSVRPGKAPFFIWQRDEIAAK
ncbi:MAG: methyltransferase domain-containing protein [Pseudomonadota bacterium]